MSNANETNAVLAYRLHVAAWERECALHVAAIAAADEARRDPSVETHAAREAAIHAWGAAQQAAGRPIGVNGIEWALRVAQAIRCAA